MAVILRYFSEFAYLPGVLRKSSRSLSHLLMTSCLSFPVRNYFLIAYDGRVILRSTDVSHRFQYTIFSSFDLL